MHFQYSPLHLGRPAFRLVKLKAGSGKEAINCELIDAFLDDATAVLDYEAVSYTWGDTTTTHNIALNEGLFSVGHNLWSLLHDVRYLDEDRILWIDAISINQNCHGERGHQVQQMDQIYRHASRVIIWLGTPTTMTDRCMHLMRKFQRFISATIWSPTYHTWRENWAFFSTLRSFDRDRYQQTFQTILDRPWFRRVWVIQEVANARAAVVYCGISHVPAETFVLCAFLPGINLPQHCRAILEIMPGPRRVTSWWSQNPNFYTILSKFSDAEATRGHDKIYALLGLCPSATESLLVDYTKPIKSVIRDTISFICGFDTSELELGDFDTAKDFAKNITRLHRSVLMATMRASHIHLAEQFLFKNMAHCRLPKPFQAVTLLEVVDELSKRTSGGQHERHNALDHERWESDGPVFGEPYRNDVWATEMVSEFLKQQDMLVDASAAGAVTAVRILLELGTEPNWPNGNGETPLHAAAGGSHLAIVQLLLERGARCDTRDTKDQTPLDKAMASRNFEVAKLLHERGANCNSEKESSLQDRLTILGALCQRRAWRAPATRARRHPRRLVPRGQRASNGMLEPG